MQNQPTAEEIKAGYEKHQAWLAKKREYRKTDRAMETARRCARGYYQRNKEKVKERAKAYYHKLKEVANEVKKEEVQEPPKIEPIAPVEKPLIIDGKTYPKILGMKPIPEKKEKSVTTEIMNKTIKLITKTNR